MQEQFLLLSNSQYVIASIFHRPDVLHPTGTGGIRSNLLAQMGIASTEEHRLAPVTAVLAQAMT
jgi:hypothetical protein